MDHLPLVSFSLFDFRLCTSLLASLRCAALARSVQARLIARKIPGVGTRPVDKCVVGERSDSSSEHFFPSGSDGKAENVRSLNISFENRYIY